MAKQIINRSNAIMRVLANIAGAEKIILLHPGMQTTAAVEPIAVTASPFGELMSSHDWFEILTDKAFVYTWTKHLDHDPSDHSSLHCVPFIPMGSTGPFDGGYRLLTSSPDAPVDENPANVEKAPDADSKDGEFNMPDQPFFGTYVRTSLGSDTYITVRLWLKKLFVSKSDIEEIKPFWKKEIETIWNAAPVSSTGKKYHFEVDWTNLTSHSTVFVWDIFNRSNMFFWALKKSVIHTAAHEFGHHLGLSDGYFYQGEIPDVAEEMIKLIPHYKDKTISFNFSTILWHAFGLNLITKNRAKERIANGELKTEQNLMSATRKIGSSGSYITEFPSDKHRNRWDPNKLIDNKLIDAIEEQRLQKIYLDKIGFLVKESYKAKTDQEKDVDGYFSVK
ncbi:MAG: hypothetical protein SD837_10345 [Candidatus Electrothrix scaldis]|nr:MAG: hypothetical protein SD837_10345 [Candidatus Electrothrix sp. GW3-3]